MYKRQLRNGAGTEARLSAAVLLATLVVLVIVGAFDAVLLLPVPALVGWSLLGALAASSRERGAIEMTALRRIAALVCVAALGGLVVTRSGAQLMAMSIYATSSKASVLERASAIDPGSYRIHARLAQLYLGRGDCKRSTVHASAAKRQFPSSPAARRLLASCGG